MHVTHIESTEQRRWAQAPIDAPGEDALTLTGDARQTILGFGGCFNELGWEALQKAAPADREAFLDELFTESGCGFNYGRVPIGANDFSLEWYSCDEVDGDFALEHFNIERDKRYTLPYVREAQKRRRGFTLFASPWSPPTWMKTKRAYNFGRLRMEDAVLSAYADYFVRFVKAYAAEGVHVSQVHVQNEPMADQKFPSCLWRGEDMRRFIRDYLGPAMEASGLDTEIWLGTINGPFSDFMLPGSSAPFSEFYDQFAGTVLSDERARRYITGVGLQWGGKHVMEEITASYPELRYMQTESECGDGQNTWAHMEYIFRQMWFYLRHGAERYTYWNMALLKGGVSTWGWAQNSLCTVCPETGALTLEPEFYLMKHAAHFVRPGARLLVTRGHWTSNTLVFENPDGSRVLLVGSNMDRERTFAFEDKDARFSARIPAHSLHTFLIEA